MSGVPGRCLNERAAEGPARAASERREPQLCRLRRAPQGRHLWRGAPRRGEWCYMIVVACAQCTLAFLRAGRRLTVNRALTHHPPSTLAPCILTPTLLSPHIVPHTYCSSYASTVRTPMIHWKAGGCPGSNRYSKTTGKEARWRSFDPKGGTRRCVRWCGGAPVCTLMSVR